MRIKNEPYRHRQAEKFISQTIIVVLFLSWCMNIAHANNTLPASKMFQGAAYQIFNRPRDQKRLFEVSERKEHDSKMVQTTPSDKLIEYVSEPLTLKENNRLLQTDKSTTTDSTQNTSTNNQSVFEQLITENMNSQSGASIVQDQNTAVVSEANDSYYVSSSSQNEDKSTYYKDNSSNNDAENTGQEQTSNQQTAESESVQEQSSAEQPTTNGDNQEQSSVEQPANNGDTTSQQNDKTGNSTNNSKNNEDSNNNDKNQDNSVVQQEDKNTSNAYHSTLNIIMPRVSHKPNKSFDKIDVGLTPRPSKQKLPKTELKGSNNSDQNNSDQTVNQVSEQAVSNSVTDGSNDDLEAIRQELWSQKKAELKQGICTDVDSFLTWNKGNTRDCEWANSTSRCDMYDVLCPVTCGICYYVYYGNDNSGVDLNEALSGNLDQVNVPSSDPARFPTASPTKSMPVASNGDTPTTPSPTIDVNFAYENSSESVYVGVSISTLYPDQRIRIRLGQGLTMEDYQQLITASDIRMGRNNAERILDATISGIVKTLDAETTFHVTDYTFGNDDDLSSGSETDLESVTTLAYNPSKYVASASDGTNGWFRVFVPLEIVQSVAANRRSLHHALNVRRVASSVDQISEDIASIMSSRVEDGSLLALLQLSDDRIKSIATIGAEDVEWDGPTDVNMENPVADIENNNNISPGGIFGIVLAFSFLVAALFVAKLVAKEKKRRDQLLKQWRHSNDGRFEIKSDESGYRDDLHRLPYKEDFEFDIGRVLTAAQFYPEKPLTPDRLNKTLSTNGSDVDNDDDSFLNLVKTHKKPGAGNKISSFLFSHVNAPSSPIKPRPASESEESSFSLPGTQSVKPPSSIVVPNNCIDVATERAAVPPAELSPTPSFILDGDNNSLQGSLNSSNKLFAKIRAARMQFLEATGARSLGAPSTLGDGDTLVGDNDTLPNSDPEYTAAAVNSNTGDDDDFRLSSLSYVENDDFDALYDHDDNSFLERDQTQNQNNKNPPAISKKSPLQVHDAESEHINLAQGLPKKGLEEEEDWNFHKYASSDCGSRIDLISDALAKAWARNDAAFAHAMENPLQVLESKGCFVSSSPKPPPPPPPPPLN